MSLRSLGNPDGYRLGSLSSARRWVGDFRCCWFLSPCCDGGWWVLNGGEGGWMVGLGVRVGWGWRGWVGGLRGW